MLDIPYLGVQITQVYAFAKTPQNVFLKFLIALYLN